MNTFRYFSSALFLSFMILQATCQKTPVAPVAEAATTDGTKKVKITTNEGTIVIRLYDATPLHRDNFIKLVSQNFYDDLLFHRVINEFMIQGGDPLSKNAQPGQVLGTGGSDMERIPAEFNKGLIHKKGVLAAARDGNPQKASSACQFYIVQGKKTSDADLNAIEQNRGIPYTAEQRNIYKTIGGTPFLDMNYTVFGEVESGLEVIDKIAVVSTDQNNRPINDIKMKIEIVN
jgi:cyclophilin family peptidyl-prolyl cis-trans isomerase